jgi:aspartate aminotransferase
MYSNPPLHGARIVNAVLSDPQLKAMWQGEIKTMAERIIKMRTLLRDGLAKAGSKRNWEHITNQIGMFSYTGMTPDQCDAITKKHEVYLTRNGRIRYVNHFPIYVTLLLGANFIVLVSPSPPSPLPQ